MFNNGVYKIDTVPVCAFEASLYMVKAPGKTLNTVNDQKRDYILYGVPKGIVASSRGIEGERASPNDVIKENSDGHAKFDAENNGPTAAQGSIHITMPGGGCRDEVTLWRHNFPLNDYVSG
ncbi:hypothetical protein AAL_08432 [Moelleriella libera RCEF 2490]|uniref:Uncharacterized protein n=1 Tax=Moelleriella libera RCEF 2490 TaxID=1081109 RepID=A0A167V7X2_9HYPO|nr:hypothetical protein AAL_08432 [Moelleriella libera RCEF 2490]